MGRWIKIHTQLLDWEWYSDTNTTRLWLHLLLSANYEDRKWKGIVIPRGSLITSVDALSEATGLTVQQVRTCLSRLISTNEISKKSTNKNTLITICKYDSYQVSEISVNKQVTNEQQTNNKQITTTIELKNIDNKESISKDIPKKESLFDDLEVETSKVVCKKKEYGPYVHMTEKEYNTLVEKYGEKDTKWIIETLGYWKMSKGKKYASDYGAINSWVVKRLAEEKAKIPRQEKVYRNEDEW